MSDENFFEHDDLVEFVAEFIMVYEAARIEPQLYIKWYDDLSDAQKGFLLEVRDKQLEITARFSQLEEETRKTEQSIIDEVNKIIK
jgi:hypothetical protein